MFSPPVPRRAWEFLKILERNFIPRLFCPVDIGNGTISGVEFYSAGLRFGEDWFLFVELNSFAFEVSSNSVISWVCHNSYGCPHYHFFGATGSREHRTGRKKDNASHFEVKMWEVPHFSSIFTKVTPILVFFQLKDTKYHQNRTTNNEIILKLIYTI